MEQEKGRLRRESRSCQKEVRELAQQLKSWKKEVEEIQSTVMEVSALLDPIDVDSEEVIYHGGRKYWDHYSHLTQSDLEIQDFLTEFWWHAVP